VVRGSIILGFERFLGWLKIKYQGCKRRNAVFHRAKSPGPTTAPGHPKIFPMPFPGNGSNWEFTWEAGCFDCKCRIKIILIFVGFYPTLIIAKIIQFNLAYYGITCFLNRSLYYFA
jgi:hypothetical protein